MTLEVEGIRQQGLC